MDTWSRQPWSMLFQILQAGVQVLLQCSVVGIEGQGCR